MKKTAILFTLHIGLISLSLGMSPASAGGYNTSIQKGAEGNTRCVDGFYWDARDGLCIAANWI